MPKYAKTGGILTIISGAFSIFYVGLGISYVIMGQLIKDTPQYRPGADLVLTIVGLAISVFFLLAGALAITGGVFTLKKKHWAMAIAGAIAGALLLFPCGIAGTILISLGKQEFSACNCEPSPNTLQQDLTPTQL